MRFFNVVTTISVARIQFGSATRINAAGFGFRANGAE